MLRSGLRDCDIPHRDKFWSRIIELWEKQIIQIKEDIAVCYFNLFLGGIFSLPSSLYTGRYG
jgi:hypothetical protein